MYSYRSTGTTGTFRVYLGLFIYGVSVSAQQDCWWTGCQPLSWEIRGCNSYDKIEAGKRDCKGGHEFNCCSSEPDKPESQNVEESSPAEVDLSCWWTGCQPKNWGVRGCAQYERSEADKRPCDQGDEFYCCPKEEKPTTPAPVEDCWWTGCQSTSWEVRGCGPYDRVEAEKRTCKDGHEFKCCAGVIDKPKPTSAPAPTPRPTKPTPPIMTDCWWTGCQPNAWATTGCKQYEKVEAERKACKDGFEYKCCTGEAPQQPPKPVPLDDDDDEMPVLTEECLWSDCLPGKSSTFPCLEGYTRGRVESCGDGGSTIECCGKPPKIEDDEVDSLTGQSYEDFVKYLLMRDKNFGAEADSLKCEMVDPGKRHMVRDKNKGYRICDLCPNLPQKHLFNTFLNRIPSATTPNLNFEECFGACFEDIKCMALSYDRSDGICYTFDSTAGKYEMEDGWNTVLMTQPSGVVQDWTFTRHTRFLGYINQSTIENNFRNCMDKCNHVSGCNYIDYSFETKNCSMFSDAEDVVYVDLVYGHMSGVRVTATLKTSLDRFIQEGEGLDAPKEGGTDTSACGKLKNGTHGAFYSQACLTGGTDLLGCDQETGCKRCYYPEKTDEKEPLVICPDSEVIILGGIRSAIANRIQTCLKDKSCVGVGYSSKTGEVSSMTMQQYTNQDYSTRIMLKYPIDEGRKYLQRHDVVPNADLNRISGERSDWQETGGKSFEECVRSFESSKEFSRASYSFTTKACKLAKENSGFVQKKGLKSVVLFREPSLLSPMLNYLRTPGHQIVSPKPKITKQCSKNCEEYCSNVCNTEHTAWCMYVSLEHKQGGGLCQFYDDVDFELRTNANAIVLSRVSSTDFTLQSLNKWHAFQNYDLFNCFQDSNSQTQTSLATVETSDVEIRALRGKRGIKDFFKKLGKGIVDGFKQVGKAIVDTGKGMVDTAKNVFKGDFKAAGESFKKIPVVDLVKNTGELAGAVFTGDWDKAKKKGSEILESDGFALVTSVGTGGIGGLAAQGAKAGIKAGIKSGVKGAIKEGTSHIDDIAIRGSRNVRNAGKNGKKPNKKPDKKKDNDKKKKKDEELEKDRGEKCENEHKRTKRARAKPTPKKSKPGANCKQQKRNKCAKPSIVNSIRVTLNDCDNKNIGKTCDYECRAGFKEVRLPLTCTAVGSQAQWRPLPTCTKEDCPAGNNPLIVVQTPQTQSHGNRQHGQHITAYVVLFNKGRKLPHWSIALHQSGQFRSKNYNAARDVARSEDFQLHPCTQLSGHQAKKENYRLSGWDRGHLTPANVARWSEKAKKVASLLINIAPQDPYTNQQPWEYLESHVECFSTTFRSVVATGICSTKIATMKGIDVPACYWKMVCYQDEKRNYQVVGFYAQNTKTTTPAQETARTTQVLTPHSQGELLQLITGGLNGVWTQPARHLASGRPIAVTGAVWFPVNLAHCSQKMDLSDDEKAAWTAAFDKQAHNLGRGKNVQPESDSDSDSDSDRRRRKRQAKASIKRGCHGDKIKSYLDQLGFFGKAGAVGAGVGGAIGAGGNKEGDGSTLVNVQNCGKRIVGYYTSWGKKTIAGLELQRLTHVIYAFLEMTADGSIEIGSPDRSHSEDVVAETRKAKERLENLLESAKRYPHIKVLFAVGGWENSQYFSSVAASPDKRLKFISSIVKMIDRYGFDGVDVDWEYPVTGGANEGVPADKQNYVQLMKELRTTLDNLADESGRSEKFLISFAGAAGQWTLDPGFDLPGLFKYIDFANIMTYDYFGAWASKWGAYTGPPAPLYFGMPPGFSGKTNADWSVKYYTCKTKQPHKINMGVPFYGRYWKNVGDSVDGKDEMWRKAEAVNSVFEGGYVPWHEVKSKYLNNGAFQKKYHEKAQAPYAWNPSEKVFLGYEDKKSMEEKVKYAVDKNVGGLMIWALELDDDDLTLLNTVSKAPLCQKTNPKDVNHKCSPIDEKRWWTPEDGEDKAGLCGRSAPLYKGYYPVCDPDDPGYSCCGAAGYCGFGPKYCDCPTCKNYREDPKTILEEPVKPSIPVTWYLLNDPDGKRGRCGRKIPKIGSVYPTCNPDDANSYCCSNGGYCGNSDEHCKCDGCINFKKDPKYQFGPKKWWTLEDGKDLGGQCGPKAPKVDGIYEAECEGTSKFHCCSPTGWCGSGKDFCECKGCKNFKT